MLWCVCVGPLAKQVVIDRKITFNNSIVTQNHIEKKESTLNRKKSVGRHQMIAMWSKKLRRIKILCKITSLRTIFVQ